MKVCAAGAGLRRKVMARKHDRRGAKRALIGNMFLNEGVGLRYGKCGPNESSAAVSGSVAGSGKNT
jgi:hypothetical protein